MKKALFLAFCLPLLAFTCNNDEYRELPCTAEAKAGLNVTVSLGAMSSITSQGITIIATDGDYSESLNVVNESDPIFSGVYERRGNYILTISKEGYRTYTSERINVAADRCHVIPRMLHVSLEPQ